MFVVAALVTHVQLRRIDRQRVAQQFGLAGPGRHAIEQLIQTVLAGQQIERPVQRGVVGRPAHADAGRPVGTVPQQRLDPAKALFLMLTQHQTRKQLRQREVPPAVTRGVSREHMLCKIERCFHHRPWRLAGQHSSSCILRPSRAQLNKRRTFRGSRQSPSAPLLSKVRYFIADLAMSICRTLANKPRKMAADSASQNRLIEAPIASRQGRG